MNAMRTILLCCVLSLPLLAQDDGQSTEYISIPKSFLSKLDITLFGDGWGNSGSLEPSDDLSELLMLSDDERKQLQTLVEASRDQVLELTIEHAEVTTAKPDHVAFTVTLPEDKVAELNATLDTGFVDILGPTRKELIDLVRKNRWGKDALADAVFGPVFSTGLDRVVTVSYKREGPTSWETDYDSKLRNGHNSSGHSSSGGDLDATEQLIAKRLLAKAQQAQAAEAPVDAPSP